MARKQRTVPLRQHYSRDLKRRIIHMSQKLHLSSTEIAILLDMPLRVVQRVHQFWTEIGEVFRQSTLREGSIDVQTGCRCMMLGLLDHSPDLFLDEIQERIASFHGIGLSLSTITRTLKRLGMTSKNASCPHTIEPPYCSQLSRAAAERCEDSRREFALKVGKYPRSIL
ncbi:hypothetical protein B0H17DRAFT_1300665 [Mycena rosella]|uniref:Winged helix-turn helix domain-containing protein n=1 Tax=Mycena rosella TaxID=1033263 RepID=A0AAD7DBP9_MYCRO|nr:hypothetical protein B0H17DRAFT_1300665 [Mycena rosella]